MISKQLSFLPALLLTSFVPPNISRAELPVQRFTGCYALKLTPAVRSADHTGQIRAALPERFELSAERISSESSSRIVLPRELRKGARGSWMNREDGMRVQWGDGYYFLVIELHERGNRLEGRAGFWTDDGGYDTWTDDASATRIPCDKSS